MDQQVALLAGGEVQDFVGVVAGEGDLGGAGQVQVVCGQVVDFVGVLVEEACSAHDRGSDQGGGHHGDEAGSDGLLHCHGHEGQFQARANTGQVVEARAGNLRAALNIDGAQGFTDSQVVLRFEALCCEVAWLAALVT